MSDSLTKSKIQFHLWNQIYAWLLHCVSQLLLFYASKHISAAELHHVSFTHFVLSVDGHLGMRCPSTSLILVQHHTDRLSSGWGKSYCHVLDALGLRYNLGNQLLLSWIMCVLVNLILLIIFLILAGLR